MRFCFSIGALAAAASLSGASVAVHPVSKPASVVRVDTRTGRLVRTIVVPSIPVRSRIAAEWNVTDVSSAAASIPDLVEQTAREHEVDPALVHSLIQAESAYNPYALSPKGAQGLMQLMPATARRFGVRNVFDPKQNIEGGVKYLKYLTTLYPHDLRLTLAAYNAGEGAVAKYGNKIPPYRETENYVYNVGRRYGKARSSQQKKPAAAAVAAVPKAAAPPSAPVESYLDRDGRLYLRNTPISAP